MQLSHIRLPFIYWLLAGLFAVITCAFAVTTGSAGVILFLALCLFTSLLAAIPILLHRHWKAPRRRMARVLRSGSIAVTALLTISLFIYGALGIYRLTSDRAALPNDRYVVVIVADGASLIQAKQLLAKGLADPSQYAQAINTNFPNISKYFLNQGAFTANGISVWPSSSIPAHTAIQTGMYPRHTGVMGQRQFDPKQRQYTSYIGLGILRHRRELDHRVKTVYEYYPHARSVDVLQIANRGCSLYLPDSPEDERVVRRVRQVIDGAGWLSRITGRSQFPRILVVTLPGIDHRTHNAPLTDAKSLQAYLDTDRYVGNIIDAYKRNGIFAKTLFVLAADHGMGEVTNHVTIDNLMHDMRFTTYQSLKWSVVPAWGSFEANAFVGTRHKFNRVYDAVPLWGGNSDALLYIKGQRVNAHGKLLGESWDLRPNDAMLESYHVGGTTIDVIQRLLTYSPGIGLILSNPAPHTFHVYARSGVGEIRERGSAFRPEFQYRILRGRDPLGYIANPDIRPYIIRGQWLSDQQWIRLTYREHYPDALRRIAFSFQHADSATLHIVAADSWDFTPYYVAKHVLVGSHGSLNAQHSLVPIMFYGPGVRRVEMPYARTVDILPTILQYLGTPAARLDGRPLPIFTNERKNLCPVTTPYDVAGQVVATGHQQYMMLNQYASYDQQFVALAPRTKEIRIILPSTKQTIPALRSRVNATAELLGLAYPDATFHRRFMGERHSDGDTFHYQLPMPDAHTGSQNHTPATISHLKN